MGPLLLHECGLRYPLRTGLAVFCLTCSETFKCVEFVQQYVRWCSLTGKQSTCNGQTGCSIRPISFIECILDTGPWATGVAGRFTSDRGAFDSCRTNPTYGVTRSTTSVPTVLPRQWLSRGAMVGFHAWPLMGLKRASEWVLDTATPSGSIVLPSRTYSEMLL